MGWSEVGAKVEPVFEYTKPTKEQLLALATDSSAKGKAFKDYLVLSANTALVDTAFFLTNDEKGIQFLFENLFQEEITLEEGKYTNSGYDSESGKMVPSIGHKIEGRFQWVFRIGTYTIPIIKRDCGNILQCKPTRRITSPGPILNYPETQKGDTVIIINYSYYYFEGEKTISPPVPESPLNFEKKRFWDTKFWKIARWPLGIGIVGVSGYFLLRDNGGNDGGPAPTPGHDGGGGPAPTPGHQ